MVNVQDSRFIKQMYKFIYILRPLYDSQRYSRDSITIQIMMVSKFLWIQAYRHSTRTSLSQLHNSCTKFKLTELLETNRDLAFFLTWAVMAQHGGRNSKIKNFRTMATNNAQLPFRILFVLTTCRTTEKGYCEPSNFCLYPVKCIFLGLFC